MRAAFPARERLRAQRLCPRSFGLRLPPAPPGLRGGAVGLRQPSCAGRGDPRRLSPACAGSPEGGRASGLAPLWRPRTCCRGQLCSRISAGELVSHLASCGSAVLYHLLSETPSGRWVPVGDLRGLLCVILRFESAVSKSTLSIYAVLMYRDVLWSRV